MAGGPAIVRQARSLLAASDDPSALRDRADLTALDVGLAARTGDRLAIDVLRASARAVGLAIGNALNLLHLERVILGGGVTASGSDYLAWAIAAARERAIEGIEVDIQLAGLGGEAPLWGASALAEGLLDA